MFVISKALGKAKPKLMVLFIQKRITLYNLRVITMNSLFMVFFIQKLFPELLLREGQMPGKDCPALQELTGQSRRVW